MKKAGFSASVMIRSNKSIQIVLMVLAIEYIVHNCIGVIKCYYWLIKIFLASFFSFLRVASILISLNKRLMLSPMTV